MKFRAAPAWSAPIASVALSAACAAGPAATPRYQERPDDRVVRVPIADAIPPPPGPRSESSVREVIQRHRAGIAYCVRCAAALEVSQPGEFVVRAAIEGSGRVAFTALRSSSVSAHVLALCFVASVYRWQFPPSSERLTTIDVVLSSAPADAAPGSQPRPCEYDTSYAR